MVKTYHFEWFLDDEIRKEEYWKIHEKRQVAIAAEQRLPNLSGTKKKIERLLIVRSHLYRTVQVATTNSDEQVKP